MRRKFLDNVRWQVVDPLGNEVRLMENNFIFHIIGQHDSKDAKVRAEIEPQAKFAVKHPRFIVNDLQAPKRVKYLSLTKIEDTTKIYIRTIAVVVEPNGEVVTWFARRIINDVLNEGDVICDAQHNNLQV